jgi:F420-non-reducing hydrogenase iron-sulfur subunit
MRLIRVMCTGRVDMEFVLRAFARGMDGVFIGGCRINECNYITQGNQQALSMVLLFRKIMANIGLNPERLRINFMTSGEGILFTEYVNDFVKKVKELGPLGKSEGLTGKELKLRLKAVENIIPYTRLVERERLRVKFNTAEEYEEYFASEEVNRLFRELIADKLAMSRIILLLQERPLTAGELSGIMGITPSEVSRHLNSSSKLGLVKFDQGQKRFIPALV